MVRNLDTSLSSNLGNFPPNLAKRNIGRSALKLSISDRLGGLRFMSGGEVEVVDITTGKPKLPKEKDGDDSMDVSSNFIKN